MYKDILAKFGNVIGEVETKEDTGDICNCECHKPGVMMMHCMPCCNACPSCGKNIKTGAFESHLRECDPDHKWLKRR